MGDTKITLRRDTDAILDDNGQKTGWVVTPFNTDTALLLMNGLKTRQNGTVTAVALKKQQIMPGEQQSFTYGGKKYRLFATGKAKPESPTSHFLSVTNYQLYLEGNLGGKKLKQLLVSKPSFDDAMVSIIFVGDLDGDGVLDFIVDTTNNYNVVATTLYLSSYAQKGHIVGIAGLYTVVGC